MTQLSDIAVKFMNHNDPVCPSTQAKALLQELLCMLRSLVDTGTTASIDIRSLPLSPGDYDYLKLFLGEGEVTATINVLGPTKISETAIPGIWWVTHSNTDEMILAESLEVTVLPELLKTQHQDLQQAVALFKSKIGKSKMSESKTGE